MTAPAAVPPNSDLVARAWLTIAVPGVGVDDDLPEVNEALRTVGFIRLAIVGGSPHESVPMRQPVINAECWVAPKAGSQLVPWNQAGYLAGRVLAASYDPAWMGQLVDIGATLGAAFAAYTPARVHTVTALEEPRRVENDRAAFARVDVPLLFLWSNPAGV